MTQDLGICNWFNPISVDEMIENGDPKHASRSDFWFAWRPVRIGALGTGSMVWLQTLWRNRCCGVTIYQRKNNDQ